MGFLMITESMEFVPANYGIAPTTVVTAIAVGGGAGGKSGTDGYLAQVNGTKELQEEPLD